VDPHRIAERRSLAYHQLVAERIRRDPRLIEQALARVARWLAEGRAPHYARAWQSVLSGSIEDVCRVVEADTEEARALRQATPFAGVIDPRERWKIWREVASSAPR
jgi:hypothetical protein